MISAALHAVRDGGPPRTFSLHRWSTSGLRAPSRTESPRSSSPPEHRRRSMRCADSRRRRPCIVGAVSDERCDWPEVTRAGEERKETMVLGLRCARTAPCKPWSGCVPCWPVGQHRAGRRGSARLRDLEAYWAKLASSRFSQPANHFTSRAIYSHPRYRVVGGKCLMFLGCEALWRGFVHDRGASPARHRIIASGQTVWTCTCPFRPWWAGSRWGNSRRLPRWRRSEIAGYVAF